MCVRVPENGQQFNPSAGIYTAQVHLLVETGLRVVWWREMGPDANKQSYVKFVHRETGRNCCIDRREVGPFLYGFSKGLAVGRIIESENKDGGGI